MDKSEPAAVDFDPAHLTFRSFSQEAQLDWMTKIIGQELAEPYSIFTYNYFISQFPHLTIMAYYREEIIGCVIGKCQKRKAYIAMIVVKKEFRRHQIGRRIFEQFYKAVENDADKIVLETECCNKAALRFYETMGFIRTRRMLNYYMSGNDAFRLKLFIR